MSKQPTIQKVAIASIIFDESFYVRWSVDRENIRRLRHALQSGAELPPIAVQKSTKRLIYGKHRLEAHLEEYGPNGEIAARLWDVDDEEAIRMALAENAEHGMPLRPIDLKRAALVAERYHLEDDEIVRLLHIPPGRLMDLRAQRGLGRRGVDGSGEPIPLKGSLAHMSGQPMTPAQIEYNEHGPGMNLTLMARQLLWGINAEALNRKNENLRMALLALREALLTLDLDSPWGGTDDSEPARSEAVPA